MTNSIAVIKLKLFPDHLTAKRLDSQSRKCNWLYNHLIEQANDLRKAYIETQDETSHE